MIHKLRVIVPLCIIIIAVLVVCALGLSTNASSEALADEAAVTYQADAWSDSGVAVPAKAQETSAALNTDNAEPEIVDDTPITPHYELSDSERVTVERIVMCEAGGEGTEGQMMVAQCIKEGMLRYHYSIDEYIFHYSVMLTSYSNVTDEVRESVSRVFDDNERVTDEKADLWYNPAITPSQWHEEQEYITTIGSHRFFWMKDNSVA